MIVIKIFNTRVYGLSESIVASGYPMKVNINSLNSLTDKSGIKRAHSLGSTKIGEGHDNFLQGIIVQADFQMPSYWWPQAQRYHWFDFVSSQSKMHRLARFDIDTQCTDNTWIESKEIAKRAVLMFNTGLIDMDTLLSNIPMGLELTARMTLNYRQLKTMYTQRKNHRLKAWTDVFIPWVESLPRIKELGVVKDVN